jgi:hypothetical protein
MTRFGVVQAHHHRQLTHIRRNSADNGGESVEEYRVRLTDDQAAYLETVIGADCSNDAEMFRMLVRDHQQYRQLLDLDDAADDAGD